MGSLGIWLNLSPVRCVGWGSRLPQFREFRWSERNWGRGLPQPDIEPALNLMFMAIDRATSLERLPLPYATALRLRDDGVADQVIAERVGVDADLLPMFMRVAEAKLAAAVDSPN